MNVIESQALYELESWFIGSLIMDGELINETILREEQLFYPSHRVLFKAMLSLRKKGEAVDLVTILGELGDAGLSQLTSATNGSAVSYLSELAGSVPTTANFKYQEKKLIEYWKKRKAKQIVSGIIDESEDRTLYEVVQELSKLDEYGISKRKPLTDSLMDITSQMIEGRVGEVTGYDTGYHDLNRMTEGWQRQDLIIVGARPSVGKTAFILNETLHTLKKNPNSMVHIFSLEMSQEKLLKRLISTLARIDANKIRRRELDAGEWARFNEAVNFFNNAPLNIYDDMGQTVPQMRAEVQKAIRENPDKDHIVMIDYLTIIGYHGKTENRVLQIDEITTGLKEMAKYFNIPVIVLAQLSRGVEGRQDKRPAISDLRDSGAIEQIADVIILLYRDDYYDRESENKNVIELIIGKQRDGSVGTVQLAFVKEYGLYVNLERFVGQ